MDLSVDIARLKRAVEDFSRVRILVLGDVMLDRFIWGSVQRISPEAPVPVVEVKKETAMLGGAANVLHNLVALGCEASLCGLVGDDEPGRQVRRLLADLKVGDQGLVVCPRRQTTVKTRVVAHGQQVVRVDREDRGHACREDTAAILSYLERQISRVDAVIVSDYAKGMVSRAVMDHLLELARGEGKIVSVDPKVINMHLYHRATIITPNHFEAISATGVNSDLDDAVKLAGRLLLDQTRAGYVLVTQGERGMTLFSKEQEVHIPTAAKQVFDVTGAGDTVISTLTLGLAWGLEPVEAAYLANVAAGVVVGEVGTSAVDGGRLLRALDDGACVPLLMED